MNLTPRNNPNLLGHEAVEATWLEQFARGKLHHAYLISGAKGIGKATLAYRMARYLLSHDAVHARTLEAPSLSLFGGEEALPKTAALPANEGLWMHPDAPLFKRVEAGTHTDLLVLEPAFDTKKQTEKADISAEAARKVPEFLSLTPAESSWRVVIVDAVDQLNHHAANALLKILEEPPANSILLMVCHAPGAILPTIRSRCQQLKLSPPTPEIFAEILYRIAPNIPSHELEAYHTLSQGSAGYALPLYQAKALPLYEQWVRALASDSESKKLQIVESIAQQKTPAQWALFMQLWEQVCQRILTASQADLFEGESVLLGQLHLAHGVADWLRYLDAGRSLLRDTTVFHLDKKQTLRMLLQPASLAKQKVG